MDRQPDHLRKYWDRLVYPKLLISEELNEIFEDNSYLQKIMLEKTIEEGKTFEKLSLPKLTEKIRYVSVNELGNYLRKLNLKKEHLSFQVSSLFGENVQKWKQFLIKLIQKV